MEVRFSPEERAQIERAARFEGRSLSPFIVEAVVDLVDLADHVVAEHTATVILADYFDRLLATPDEPDRAPQLERAAARAARRPRIR